MIKRINVAIFFCLAHCLSGLEPLHAQDSEALRKMSERLERLTKELGDLETRRIDNANAINEAKARLNEPVTNLANLDKNCLAE
jgi:hypothetical protein